MRLAVALSVLFAVAATGCHSGKTPEMRVLGLQDQATSSHVFVQVRNPASRPMRLTRLQYTFASAKGTTVSEGDVVLEVPLETPASEPLELTGKVTAETGTYVRTFTLLAQIQPH